MIRRFLASTLMLGAVAISGLGFAQSDGARHEETLQDQTEDAEQNRGEKPADMTGDTEKFLNKAGEEASDTWVTGKIKERFMADDLVKGSDIQVTTTNHTVWLHGTVQSREALYRALKILHATKGVAHVKDRLRIVPTA